MIAAQCRNCDKAIMVRPYRVRTNTTGVFCSNKCATLFRHQQNRLHNPKFIYKSPTYDAARRNYTLNRQQILERGRAEYAALRAAALYTLGDCCCRCGFADRRALQIDHVNGGGYQERKNLRVKGVYRAVLADTSGRYQCLCANCNQIKKVENNEKKQPAGKIIWTNPRLAEAPLLQTANI